MFDILEAVKRTPVFPQDGKTGGRLPRDEVADGLVGSSGPAHLKGPGNHVISACHHGGGQQKGILQGHAAKGAIHFRPGRQGFHGLPVRPEGGEEPLDSDGLFRQYTGVLAGGGAIRAAIGVRQTLGRPYFVVEEERPQESSGVHAAGTGIRAGRLGAEEAAARLPGINTGLMDHAVRLPIHRFRPCMPSLLSPRRPAEKFHA